MKKTGAVTIKDIALASGVSYPTVSHVLNNTRGVSPATRQRVQDAIAALNYHPSAVARGLLKRSMNTLGVVLPYRTDFLIADPYLGPIIEGILGVAQARRQAVMLFTNSQSGARGRLDDVGLYCDGRCDGLLFVHERTDSELIAVMQQKRVPFVCVNELCAGSPVSAVDSAEVEGAAALTRYLIERGHRRIAFLAGEDPVISVHQRQEGFENALAAAGIPLDPALLLPGRYDYDTGYARTRQLIADYPDSATRPTALMCCNDLIAFGAQQALADAGISVPHDLSIVGFDDIPAAAAADLTTMHLPFREAGTRATEILLSQIQLGDDAPIVQETLPMRLIERGTVTTIATNLPPCH